MRPAAVLSPVEAAGDLSTVAGIAAYLGKVAAATASGALDPKVSNATVYALSALLRVIEPDELDQDIEDLRDQLTELKRRSERHGDSGTAAEG
jgi:hypothetical protein